MPSSNDDYRHMAAAIALARRGLYTARPNPVVGCVLVSQGRVIGEGWHAFAGGPHAEIEALQDARQRDETVAGATAYVSLEPCCFHGKTGPCSQALIEAQVARVVYAMEDPNPRVAGVGIQQLRDAGIEIAGPLLEAEARLLNQGFIKRMVEGMPLVRVKLAMSLDGRTAMASGESKWITGPAARADVQRLRARSCAVISGIDTVLRDDPSLNLRAGELDLGPGELPAAEQVAQHQPLRVVLDSSARLPASARVLASPGEVLVVNSGSASGNVLQGAETVARLEQLELGNGKPRINLRKLLQHLAERQCNEVLVEAGATLAGQFVQQGLVDEIIIYMAPKLMGSSARPLFDMPLDTMAAQLGLKIADIRAVGKDWRITASVDPES